MNADSVESIREYLEISNNLATAGQPNRVHFSQIAQAGFEKVINLATDESPGALPDEGDVVRQLGMAYSHIPVVWTQPTNQDLTEFFGAMQDSSGIKLFVHCALNMRVSVFVFLHRVLVLGESKQGAWERVLEIWQPNEVWQSFIDRQLGGQVKKNIPR